MIDVRRIEIAAAVVEFNHLFERGKVAIVKIVTAQPGVAQAGGAKLADVVRIAGDLETARVFCLGPHADIVKRVVAEQSSRMTNVTS